MSDHAELAQRLTAATASHRLLDHPFYKAWAAGTLSRDDLAFYATQYWRQVEAFPEVLSDLESRLDGPASQTIAANLADERDDDHPQMWLDFAAALGVESGAVSESTPEPETAACVQSFRTAAREASPAFALGMLYGYESQSPEVSKTKVEGLREHYGIEGGGVTYFNLHGELDVEHSAQLAAAISSVASDADLEAAEAGAAAGAQAVWGLLDGVARARGIC